MRMPRVGRPRSRPVTEGNSDGVDEVSVRLLDQWSVSGSVVAGCGGCAARYGHGRRPSPGLRGVRPGPLEDVARWAQPRTSLSVPESFVATIG
jgi:hypothetical protein